MKKETWKNKQLAKQQQQKENLIIGQPVLNETIYGAVLPPASALKIPVNASL